MTLNSDWSCRFLKAKNIYVCYWPAGRSAYRENCDLGHERPRTAFLSPRSQFFPIRTDPKPANNIFRFFFLAVNWLTSGFVYATLPLNRLTNHSQKSLKKNH